MVSLNDDKDLYVSRRNEILDALSGKTGIINGISKDNREDVFYMLLFCLSVPQSKAVKVDKAISQLRDRDYYRCHLNQQKLFTIISGLVRFPRQKTLRIIEAKNMFLDTDFFHHLKEQYDQYVDVKNMFHTQHPTVVAYLQETREWLVENVNGMGFKGASHFMRNTGMGGLAILDVHILRALHERKVIPSAKPTLSPSVYRLIENKMIWYAGKVGISTDELDLLFWSLGTGHVFK